MNSLRQVTELSWQNYLVDNLSPMIIGEILLPFHTDKINSSLIIGEIFVPTLCRPNYHADDHRHDFCAFLIQTGLPRPWSSARFWFLPDTQKITLLLIIGEIFVRYTERITSPLIIGETFVPSLDRENYHAADHWGDFRPFLIQTELPRCESSPRKKFWISGTVILAYESNILKTWHNFTLSVYWNNHIIPGFVPFFRNKFPGLFQDFSRTRIDFSRALKVTLTPTLPRSQC